MRLDDPFLTDDAVLAELGERIARERLTRNLTQQALAAEAGVSKTTVERVEKGLAVTLPNFIRVLRALSLLGGLEQLVPPAAVSPIEIVRQAGRTRRRATGSRATTSQARPRPSTPFSWGDERERGAD